MMLKIINASGNIKLEIKSTSWASSRTGDAGAFGASLVSMGDGGAGGLIGIAIDDVGV